MNDSLAKCTNFCLSSFENDGLEGTFLVSDVSGLGFVEKYNEVPEHLETKLLPFQRDGVRYVFTSNHHCILCTFICGPITTSVCTWCSSMQWNILLRR